MQIKPERETVERVLDSLESPFLFTYEGQRYKFKGCKTWGEAEWATKGYNTALENVRQALSGKGGE
jgi:hypothetical protein